MKSHYVLFKFYTLSKLFRVEVVDVCCVEDLNDDFYVKAKISMYYI